MPECVSDVLVAGRQYHIQQPDLCHLHNMHEEIKRLITLRTVEDWLKSPYIYYIYIAIAKATNSLGNG